MLAAAHPAGAGRVAAEHIAKDSDGPRDGALRARLNGRLEALQRQVCELRAELEEEAEGDELKALRRRCASLESEAEELRSENAELREQLQKLTEASSRTASKTSLVLRYRPEDLDFSPLTGGRRTCPIMSTEDRGICPFQLRAILDFLASHTSAGSDWSDEDGVDDKLNGWHDVRTNLPVHLRTMNLHQLMEWVVKPCTEAEACSYVEMIAQDPACQKPRWFVSHWWGIAVVDFVKCVEAHQELRCLPKATAYWICAYANNQWALQEEIVDDPAQTSFRKAMQRCLGTLSILDRGNVVFTRIWCSYEISMTVLEGQDKPYDLATVTSEGSAAILSSGLTAEDEEEGRSGRWRHVGGAGAAKVEREKKFPLDVMVKGLHVRLEKGEASQDVDRRRILNAISGCMNLEAEPPARHPQYDEVNRALRWRFAMACYEQAFEADRLDELGLRDVEPPANINVNTCSSIAKAFHAQGKYLLAIEFFKKSLGIQLQTLGPKHPEVGRTYEGMANALSAQGQSEQALALYEKALEGQIKALGPGHSDVAQIYIGMARVYNYQGQREKALELYEKSLGIQLKKLGLEHPVIGQTYLNMAIVYNDQGHAWKALELYKKSLSIQLKALGPKHPEVGRTYVNMAMVYSCQGQRRRSLELYEKSLGIQSMALGEEHPELGRTYMGMAHVYYAQGLPERALELYERSLDVQLRALGAEHPDVGRIYMGMADVCSALRQRGKALELYEKSLGIQLKALGPEHPDVGRTYASMAVAYNAQGEGSKAMELYRKSWAIQRKLWNRSN